MLIGLSENSLKEHWYKKPTAKGARRKTRKTSRNMYGQIYIVRIKKPKVCSSLFKDRNPSPPLEQRPGQKIIRPDVEWERGALGQLGCRKCEEHAAREWAEPFAWS